MASLLASGSGDWAARICECSFVRARPSSFASCPPPTQRHPAVGLITPFTRLFTSDRVLMCSCYRELYFRLSGASVTIPPTYHVYDGGWDGLCCIIHRTYLSRASPGPSRLSCLSLTFCSTTCNVIPPPTSVLQNVFTRFCLRLSCARTFLLSFADRLNL